MDCRLDIWNASIVKKKYYPSFLCFERKLANIKELNVVDKLRGGFMFFF